MPITTIGAVRGRFKRLARWPYRLRKMPLPEACQLSLAERRRMAADYLPPHKTGHPR